MLELVPLTMTFAALAGYVVALRRLRRRGDHWPVGRTCAMVTGAALVGVALLPPLATHDELFPVHVGQHLLLGMTAPALLALSAPVTLALRTLPRGARRILLGVLHTRAVAVVTSPAVAAVLDLGGLYVLYLTGLFQRAEGDPLLHAAIHLHMFAAGCLFSWAIVGVDPIRGRTRVQTRLAVLTLAAAGHDILSKLVYARGLPVGGGALADRHAGAVLMYYGGSVVDVALAVVVMTQWWRATGRALARTSRRSARPVPALPD